MIKVENIRVYNVLPAIQGARNPLESWDRMDSKEENGKTVLGPNDLGLMRRLFKAGKDHRKYTRQILVSMDITAPDYFFREFDTYKVGTIANSTSQMHKIMERPFTPDMFSCENMRGYKKEVLQYIPEFDVSQEVWKQYNALYEVSNFGRVKRRSYVTSNGSIQKERILKYSLSTDKYLKSNLITDEGRRDYRTHRLVAEVFIPIPEKYKDISVDQLHINHKDGNKLNNAVDNLEWCTAKENIAHSRENNLQPSVCKTYKGKFDEYTRNQIKQLEKEGWSRKQLAKKYHVSHTCISDIVNDKYRYADYINEYEQFKQILQTMNELREEWLEEQDPIQKDILWKSVVQMCPQSWNYKRHLTMNLEVLYNMYYARKSHKLKEWREFCDILVNEVDHFAEIAEIEK